MEDVEMLTPEELTELDANYERMLNVIKIGVAMIEDQDQADRVLKNAETAIHGLYDLAASGDRMAFAGMRLIADQAEQNALKAGALAKTLPLRLQ